MGALLALLAILIVKTVWLWSILVLFTIGLSLFVYDWVVKLWSRRS